MLDLNDEELVQHAQRGSPEAVSELYDRHHTRIFRYVRSRIYNTHLAQDLTGEVFLQMVKHLPAYRPTGVPFSAWLYRIAHNHIINHAGRKENTYHFMPLVYANDASRREDNPARIVEQKLELEEIQHALERIDEIQREVVILRFLLGFSLKEVAQMLNKTVAAVKSIQHRGLLALEVAMKHEQQW